MLEDILYWVDAEGFGTVGEGFLIKELAVLNNETKTSRIQYFKVGNFHKLSKDHRNQALFLKRSIHGLKFIDERGDLTQNEAREIIKRLCIEAEKKNKFIAYKGAAHMDYIFKTLNFSHVGLNLETLDCLPYSKIISDYEFIYEKYKILHCSRHFYLNNGELGRCSLVKNYVYLDFFNHNRRNYNSKYPIDQTHRCKISSPQQQLSLSCNLIDL